MTISTEQVRAIARWVDEQELDTLSVAALRDAFPGLHFTVCSDDDIGAARAAHEAPAFNLYLVGGGEHCLSLTDDHEQAVGVVVAAVYPDED